MPLPSELRAIQNRAGFAYFTSAETPQMRGNQTLAVIGVSDSGKSVLEDHIHQSMGPSLRKRIPKDKYGNDLEPLYRMSIVAQKFYPTRREAHCPDSEPSSVLNRGTGLEIVCSDGPFMRSISDGEETHDKQVHVGRRGGLFGFGGTPVYEYKKVRTPKYKTVPILAREVLISGGDDELHSITYGVIRHLPDTSNRYGVELTKTAVMGRHDCDAVVGAIKKEPVVTRDFFNMFPELDAKFLTGTVFLGQPIWLEPNMDMKTFWA